MTSTALQVESAAAHFWRVDGLFNRPPFVARVADQAAAKQLLRCACVPCQLSESEPRPLVLKQDVRIAIICLLSLGRPATVSRLVVAAVVDAVKRMQLGWPLAHVFQKRIETVLPFVADGYAFSKVVGVGGAARIAAAGNHILPRAIGRTFLAGRVLMGPDAATTALTKPNRLGHLDALCSALALGKPKMVLGGLPLIGDSEQAAKLPSCVVTKRLPHVNVSTPKAMIVA